MTWKSIPLLVASLLVACAQAENPPASGAKAAPVVGPAPSSAPSSAVGESSEEAVAVTITYCIP
ncbi:MAG: hypothetical protein AAGF11_47935 [Myxococcota bacterium]